MEGGLGGLSRVGDLWAGGMAYACGNMAEMRSISSMHVRDSSMVL